MDEPVNLKINGILLNTVLSGIIVRLSDAHGFSLEDTAEVVIFFNTFRLSDHYTRMMSGVFLSGCQGRPTSPRERLTQGVSAHLGNLPLSQN